LHNIAGNYNDTELIKLLGMIVKCTAVVDNAFLSTPTVTVFDGCRRAIVKGETKRNFVNFSLHKGFPRENLYIYSELITKYFFVVALINFLTIIN